MAFCVNCGNQLPNGSCFCGNCGAQQGAPAAAPVQPVQYAQQAAPVQQTRQPALAPNQMQKNGIIFTRADVIDYEIFGDDTVLIGPGQTANTFILFLPKRLLSS